MFGLASGTKGQTSNDYLDTLVNEYVSELRSKSIDTICIYEDYCVGCLYMWKKSEDKCDFKGLFVPTYIFWTDKGQTYMTKKDNCFNYSVIKVPNDSIWTYFFENRDTIRTNELKVPQYFEMKNGKQELFSSSVNHSTHQGIKIIVEQNTIIDKDLDDYYLSEEVGFAEHENINYEYNLNSHLKKFQLLIHRTIESAIKVNPLTKTRR